MGGFIILMILQKVSFGIINLHEWFLCLINIGSQSTNFLFYCIEDTSKASSTIAHERYSLSTQAFGRAALCINCHKFPGPSIKIVKILFCPVHNTCWVPDHWNCIHIDNVNFVTGMCMSMGPEYIWWQRAKYSFMISFFILLCLMLSASKTPRYLYAPSSSSDLMVSSIGKLIPEDSTLRPRLIDKVTHF